MGCNCAGGKSFVWTDGTKSITYKTEVEARAQVIRAGGTYEAVSVAA